MENQEKIDSSAFCFWLQGFAEISNTKRPTQRQWAAIVAELNKVFNKVTPSRTIAPTGVVLPKAGAPLCITGLSDWPHKMETYC